MREVVVVSGLWVPSVAMALLEARLRSEGFRPRPFGYYGRASLAQNVDRLARFVRSSCDSEPHFVGHSLGGVLIFDMLSACPDVSAAQVVLIGAPVRGSLSGRRLARWGIGRWMLGGSAARWLEREAAWPRREPLGVVAGTLGAGLGRILGALPGEHDGVVCVPETEVAGMAQRILVREAHSQLPFSARVAALAGRFLREGRFA